MTTTVNMSPDQTVLAAELGITADLISDYPNPYLQAWAQFREETAGHELQVLHNDGLYRHLRMATPGTGVFSWEVVTWPGRAAFCGDIGIDGIFTRDTDMLEFFTRRRDSRYADGAPWIDFRYWAEKLGQGPTVRVYSKAKFIANVRDYLFNNEDGRRTLWGTEQERKGVMEDAELVDDHRDTAHAWLSDTEPFSDTGDWSDWEVSDFDHHFILTCYALDALVKAWNTHTGGAVS